MADCRVGLSAENFKKSEETVTNSTACLTLVSMIKHRHNIYFTIHKYSQLVAWLLVSFFPSLILILPGWETIFATGFLPTPFLFVALLFRGCGQFGQKNPI